MVKSMIFGLASTLAGAKKYKFALVGLHFAFLGYQLLKKRRNKSEKKRLRA